MSYRVPKNLEKNPDRLLIVVRLRQVSNCKLSNLLPTISFKPTAIKTCKVLKKAAASSERRQVSMRGCFA
jgi:hypothetical protein